MNQLKMIGGKSRPYHGKMESLLSHSLAVAACFKAIVRGTAFDAPDFIFGAIIHDIGKVHGSFQETIYNAFKRELAGQPREKAGDRYLHNIGGMKYMNLVPGSLSDVARASLYHHSYFTEGKADLYFRLGNRKKKNTEAAIELIKEALKISGAESYSVKRTGYQLHAFAGYLMLADHIMSSDYNKLRSTLGESVCFEDEVKKAREIVSAFNIKPQKISPSDILGEHTPRPIQRHAIDNQCTGLTIIEAPMGEGKTEAALLSLMDTGRRLCMLMPSRATANGIIRDKAGKISPFCAFSKNKYGVKAGIYHSDADIPSEVTTDSLLDDGELNCRFERSTRFLYPSTVMTVDQAAYAVTSKRDNAMRAALLSSSAVIFDEVHSYDPKCSMAIESLLRFLGAMKVPVVMLSATLSPGVRSKFTSAYGVPCEDADYGYPVTWDNGTPTSFTPRERKEVMFEHVDNPIESLLNHAGDCSAVIFNSINEAKSFYSKVKDEIPNAYNHIILFHSRYTTADRRRIESQVLDLCGKQPSYKKNRSVLVIATQVIEQSLDLDFDYIISEPAPVDALYQRAGRLHRHFNRGLPVFGVMDGSYYVYKESGTVDESLKIMMGIKSLPCDIQADVERIESFQNEPQVSGEFINLDNTLDNIARDFSRYVSRDIRDGASMELAICKGGDYVNGSRKESTVSVRKGAYGLNEEFIRTDQDNRMTIELEDGFFTYDDGGLSW